jgi:hypothetical protein
MRSTHHNLCHPALKQPNMHRSFLRANNKPGRVRVGAWQLVSNLWCMAGLGMQQFKDIASVPFQHLTVGVTMLHMQQTHTDATCQVLAHVACCCCFCCIAENFYLALDSALQESSPLAVKFSGPLAVVPALVSQAMSRGVSPVSKKSDQQLSHISNTSQQLCAINPSPITGLASMSQHESQLVW